MNAVLKSASESAFNGYDEQLNRLISLGFHLLEYPKTDPKEAEKVFRKRFEPLQEMVSDWSFPFLLIPNLKWRNIFLKEEMKILGGHSEVYPSKIVHDSYGLPTDGIPYAVTGITSYELGSPNYHGYQFSTNENPSTVEEAIIFNLQHPQSQKSILIFGSHNSKSPLFIVKEEDGLKLKKHNGSNTSSSVLLTVRHRYAAYL